ncbi:winged helix DNA-binding domain-containing protein [Paenibacillus pasadenensis]|uniref:DNA glycosylase AlkZ-like family protein n=1 Tax=Paenibacillus pasadenensis TaxID=217090 RepID=UPI00203D8C81|nr:crosslink repair DNA glycosylase YcaQ family protein [Paenibacillus pasadenensis]MCM3745829.1 winged helix DNA-binding domain-containing protein [Paenibacillus pasadenensis]
MAIRTVNLTNEEARRFLLDHHGLGPVPAYRGKQGIMDYITRAGCIQFDPLDAAGRNAELVLQARLPDFRPSMLDELLYKDRLLLDGLDKVMSIYPAADWPHFRRTRAEAKQQFGSKPEIAAFVPTVRQALLERGPLLSRELESGVKLDWAWAPARLSKATMESMYLWGELVIARKQRNQRVYDLAEHLLLQELLDTPDPHPDDRDYARWRVMRRVGGVGLLHPRASDAWVGTRFMKTADRTSVFRDLSDEGHLTQVDAPGLSAPHYARTEDLDRWLGKYSKEQWEAAPPRSMFLAPLDNFLWDRRLIRELFEFTYIWEVYKPADARQYGYYVLPVLWGDRLIARMEPGREKGSAGARTVEGWWPEPDLKWTPSMEESVRLAFQQFRAYLGCERIKPTAAALNAEPRLEHWLSGE